MKSKSKSQPWKCSHCDKSFKYLSEKSRHEQSHIPQFECKVCKKKFSFLSAVRRHEKQHERSGDVKCDQCGGSFRDETLLKRHIQYAHKGTFSCSKCIAVFNSDSALCSHMKSHRPVSERQYHCPFPGCDKTFNFSHHLKHHTMTHTNDKQHFCKECGKGFIQLHHLKIHQKSHTPDNWLPCLASECKKRFSNKYARKRHMALHKMKLESGDSSQSNEHSTDDVVCVSCNKYITKQYYDKHISECTNTIINDNTKTTLTFKCKEENNFEIDEGVSIVTKSVRDKMDITKADDENQNETDYTCKTVLGGCLMKGNSDVNDSCICAQMPVHEISVPEVIEDMIINVLRENNDNGKKCDDNQKNCVKVNLSDADITRNTPSCERTSCSGCECYNTCENRIEQDEIPDIEYINGTVKINPTDLSVNHDKAKIAIKEAKVVLSNCKDVLGNCIVSGDGTMGEGCLCAKMAMYDRQVIEQQIEEITPHPESTWNN